MGRHTHARRSRSFEAAPEAAPSWLGSVSARADKNQRNAKVTATARFSRDRSLSPRLSCFVSLHLSLYPCASIFLAISVYTLTHMHAHVRAWRHLR